MAAVIPVILCLAGALGAELADKLKNPMVFQWVTGGAVQPPITLHGYDVTLVIDVCKAILQAQGKLKGNQQDYVCKLGGS